MHRRLANLLRLLSLLAAIIVAVLWWRSARWVDVLIEPRHHQDRWLVTSEFGVVVVERQEPQRLKSGAPDPTWVFFNTPLPRRYPGNWGWLGFDLYETDSRHYLLAPLGRAWGVVVPHWFLVLFALLPSILWLLRRRRRAHRRTAGLCPECGYDLRESAGRCPECGSIASSTHLAARC